MAAEDKKGLYHVKDPKNTTIYDKTIDYIEGKYNIMYNEISHDFQISVLNQKNWFYLNLNSLIIELAKAGIEVSTSKLEILLKSELILKYNPVKEYFESLHKWDGDD
jgi:hypothetical protein